MSIWCCNTRGSNSEANDLVIAEYALDPILRASVRKFAPQFVAKRLALNYDGTDLTVITVKSGSLS